MNTNYNNDNVKLTSAEIASLWSSYIFETLMHHIFTYFANNVIDKEIRTYVKSMANVALSYFVVAYVGANREDI